MPPMKTAKPQRGQMVNPKPPASFPTMPMPSNSVSPGKSATAKSPINPAGKMRGWAKQGRTAPGAPKPASAPGAGAPPAGPTPLPRVTSAAPVASKAPKAKRMTAPGLKAPKTSTSKARGKSATAHSPINPAGKTRGWAKNRPARRNMPPGLRVAKKRRSTNRSYARA